MQIVKTNIIVSVIILYTVLLTPVFGQIMSSAELKMMTVLNTGSNLIPKDIQSSKTIVVISIQNESSLRGDWKTLAEEAHFYIKKLLLC